MSPMGEEFALPKEADYAEEIKRLRQMVEQRRIDADPALGRRIIDYSVRAIAADVLELAQELGVAEPWFLSP